MNDKQPAQSELHAFTKRASDSAMRTIPRRRFLVVGLIAGSATLAACASPAAAPPAAPTSASAPAPAAGTTSPAPAPAKPTAITQQPAAPAKKLATDLKVAAPSINPTMDPHGALSTSGFMQTRQFADALVTWDDKGEKVIPQLASEWKRIDPLTLEFKLRDDVKFSNGENFDAEAVRFTLDRVQKSTEPAHVDTKARMVTFAGAEVVNSTTVRLKTKEPDPLTLNRLSMLFMAPPKYVAGGGDMNTKPIGTGSLKVAEFTTNQQIKFEAWDGSWRGKPTIQTATLFQIREPATMISALKTGQVDIIARMPPDQVAPLQRDGFNVGTMDFGSCVGMVLPPSHPLNRDKRVREAFNLAVNKEEMLKTVQAGLGKISQGQTMQPGFVGYRDDLKPFPYDPERARSLLSQANVGDQEILVQGPDSVKPYIDAFVGYLQAVGVKARTELIELATLIKVLNSGTDRPSFQTNNEYFNMRDFNAFGFRYVKDWAAPWFDNDEFTRLYKLQEKEVDVQKRGALLGQMAGIMHDEFAGVFLFHVQYPTVYSKKISQLRLPYDAAYYFWTVEKEA